MRTITELLVGPRFTSCGECPRFRLVVQETITGRVINDSKTDRSIRFHNTKESNFGYFVHSILT